MMNKIEKLEFKQYFNRSVVESFIEYFINCDLDKLNELLSLTGVYCGMEKYVFLEHIGNIIQVEQFKLKDYRQNYSIHLKPSELVHSFTFKTYEYLEDEMIESEIIRMNLLITLKDNQITSIISEKNYIDSAEFEKRQFYN